jgi:two-component system NtrC family response regulator
MAKVLIIDDDENFCAILSKIVEREAHEAVGVHTLQKGVHQALCGHFDIVFLDVQLPDGNGLDLLPRIMDAPSSPEVIIITGQGDPDGAELAIKNGAWDYIEKPSSIKEITLPLVRAIQYQENKKAARPPVALQREGIVGRSPQIRSCLDLVAKAGGSDASVLITGETGTGKELFARSIHENSSRRDGNYVVVDCASLPETLVESTLFGHVKGAFTGAERAMDGLIRHADGGTVLLDEVGELPVALQKTFLRVLQEKRFRPVGSKVEVNSNFRLIASTNRDLDAMVKKGLFRRDLLFRLRSFSIELPPLRGRSEDIRELAMHYMARLCDRYGEETKGFSTEFLDALYSYPWPGNIRELVNAMESALAVSRSEPMLFVKHLPETIRVRLAREKLSKESPGKTAPVKKTVKGSPFPPLKDFRNDAVAKLEKQYLSDLIAHTDGVLKEAHKISGLGKSRFYDLLKKYDIPISK